MLTESDEIFLDCQHRSHVIGFRSGNDPRQGGNGGLKPTLHFQKLAAEHDVITGWSLRSISNAQAAAVGDDLTG